MHKVFFFRTPSGNEPVREFLQSIEKEDRQVIGFDLQTVQDGFPIGMPVCRPIGGGLYEVRSTLRSRKEARIVFFVAEQSLVVVHGFIKKTRTTPKGDIDLAKERKSEFLANRSDGSKTKAQPE
jgi:phage-related protein